MGRQNENDDYEKKEDFDYDTKEWKIACMGSGGVGKCALTIQFCMSHFIQEYDPTIEDSYRKHIEVNGIPYLLDILVTAGQEEYNVMREGWIQPSQIFFLVFALDSRGSFEGIPQLLEEIRRIKGDLPYRIVLVGNKKDLKREIPLEELKEFAESEGVPYVETSAKTREGVDDLFYDALKYAINGAFTWSETKGKNVKKASSC